MVPPSNRDSSSHRNDTADSPSAQGPELQLEVRLQQLEILNLHPGLKAYLCADGEIRFAKYRLNQILSCRGQAVVALAEDPDLDRQVVLKIYLESVSADGQSRLMSEGRALAQIDHPCVAKCHAIDQHAAATILVMEYVSGHPLSLVLAEEVLSLTRALRIIHDIAAGLEAIHRAGLVHRDLKPANVMITDRGRVKLIDLGLVASADAAVEETGIGTPAYVSPEQATVNRSTDNREATAVDQRTDVFGVGAILYHMLVGEPPFHAASKDAMWQRARAGDITPVAELRPSIPHDVVGLCDRCLERAPEKRFGSAGELRRAVESLMNRRRGRKRVAVVLGGAAASLVVAVLLWLVAWKPEPVSPAGQDYFQQLVQVENRLRDPAIDFRIEIGLDPLGKTNLVVNDDAPLTLADGAPFDLVFEPARDCYCAVFSFEENATDAHWLLPHQGEPAVRVHAGTRKRIELQATHSSSTDYFLLIASTHPWHPQRSVSEYLAHVRAGQHDTLVKSPFPWRGVIQRSRDAQVFECLIPYRVQRMAGHSPQKSAAAE